jgi:hypothetical protein
LNYASNSALWIKFQHFEQRFRKKNPVNVNCGRLNRSYDQDNNSAGKQSANGTPPDTAAGFDDLAFSASEVGLPRLPKAL